MRRTRRQARVETLIVALPESAGSALYGMLDVLRATGNLWQTLARSYPPAERFRVRIVSAHARPFRCGNGIPVHPDCAVREDPRAQIVVLPELWLGPDEDLAGRSPGLVAWIRRRYQTGS